MIEETIIITESIKNTVFSAVISKLISDGIDIGREKIREIIKNKSNKNIDITIKTPRISVAFERKIVEIKEWSLGHKPCCAFGRISVNKDFQSAK